MKQKFLLCALLITISSIGISQNYQLDSSFGKNGTISHPKFGTEKIAILPDGRIVTIASAYYATPNLTCTFPNGSPDRSFGKNGKVILPADLSNPILLVQNDKIIVGGLSKGKTLVVRFNNNGTLDNSFANGRKGQGISETAPLEDIKLRTDGKLILIFYEEYYPEQYSIIWQVCLKENGTVNTSYGENGTSKNIFDGRYYIHATSFAIDNSNRIFASGHYTTELFSTELRIIGFKDNGSIDSSFGSSGSLYVSYILSYPEAVVSAIIEVLANGNILTAGKVVSGSVSRIYMFECKPDGTTESAFGKNGIVTVDSYDDIYKIVEQDEKIYLAAGESKIFRFLKNGTIDSDFSDKGILTVSIGGNNSDYSDIMDFVLLQNSDIVLAYYGQTAWGSPGQEFLAKYTPVNLFFKTKVNINNISNENTNLSLFPNPSSDFIHITGLKSGKAVIQIINNAGKIVKAVNFENEGLKIINIQNLPSGIYYVQVEQNNEVKSLKFVKQ